LWQILPFELCRVASTSIPKWAAGRSRLCRRTISSRARNQTTAICELVASDHAGRAATVQVTRRVPRGKLPDIRAARSGLSRSVTKPTLMGSRRSTGRHPVDARVFLLLSGFPTAGYMFGELIRALSDFLRVMAPDLPRLINRIAALTASLIALFAPWQVMSVDGG
jgi:hypothetical protein